MLLDIIKADQLKARIDKEQFKSKLLTTLLGEIELQLKGKEVKSEDVICSAVIKKFVKNIDTNLKHSPDHPAFLKEREILNTYLPKQMTEEELTSAIQSIMIDVGSNFGMIMKELKKRYSSLYDGKVASQIVKGLL